jgi:hypothetical protein
MYVYAGGGLVTTYTVNNNTIVLPTSGDSIYIV